MRPLRDLTLEDWRQLIDQQRRNGQTIAAFCRARGLRETRFHYWRKRIDSILPGFVRVTPVMDGPRCDNRYEICLGNGKRLRVASGFDEMEVRRLVSMLEA